MSLSGPAPAGAVSVPSGAIAMIGDKTIVFVATGGGYAIRDETLGGSGGGSVEGHTVLLSGVRPGEQVVISGTSALKALARSDEHTSELQSLMRLPYAVLCMNK